MCALPDEAKRPKRIAINHLNNKDMTTYILPVYYAPYLINDDATGLSDDDKQLIDAFLSENEPGYCVDADVDNAYFSPRNDVDGWLGNDVCEFKFVKL